MTTSITHRRTPAEKQEAALVAAFRRMLPRDRVKLLRAVRPSGIQLAFKRGMTP
ncbi:MAG: hypothetical protein Q7J42_06895 [Sulfuritalea sp.]|nr:hypothetical protein [Sulfuritalea sp.]